MGIIGKFLAQLRLGLSPLNSHRFNFNLTENPICPSCNEKEETTLHYFLECDKYAGTLRIDLWHKIDNLSIRVFGQSESKLNIITSLMIVDWIVRGFQIHNNIVVSEWENAICCCLHLSLSMSLSLNVFPANQVLYHNASPLISGYYFRFSVCTI